MAPYNLIRCTNIECANNSYMHSTTKTVYPATGIMKHIWRSSFFLRLSSTYILFCVLVENENGCATRRSLAAPQNQLIFSMKCAAVHSRIKHNESMLSDRQHKVNNVRVLERVHSQTQSKSTNSRCAIMLLQRDWIIHNFGVYFFLRRLRRGSSLYKLRVLMEFCIPCLPK